MCVEECDAIVARDCFTAAHSLLSFQDLEELNNGSIIGLKPQKTTPKSETTSL